MKKIGYIFLILIILVAIYWIFFSKRCKYKKYKDCGVCADEAMDALSENVAPTHTDLIKVNRIIKECEYCGCDIKDQFEAWLDDVVGGSPIIWEIENTGIYGTP